MSAAADYSLEDDNRTRLTQTGKEIPILTYWQRWMRRRQAIMSREALPWLFLVAVLVFFIVASCIYLDTTCPLLLAYWGNGLFQCGLFLGLFLFHFARTHLWKRMYHRWGTRIQGKITQRLYIKERSGWGLSYQFFSDRGHPISEDVAGMEWHELDQRASSKSSWRASELEPISHHVQVEYEWGNPRKFYSKWLAVPERDYSVEISVDLLAWQGHVFQYPHHVMLASKSKSPYRVFMPWLALTTLGCLFAYAGVWLPPQIVCGNAMALLVFYVLSTCEIVLLQLVLLPRLVPGEPLWDYGTAVCLSDPRPLSQGEVLRYQLMALSSTGSNNDVHPDKNHGQQDADNASHTTVTTDDEEEAMARQQQQDLIQNGQHHRRQGSTGTEHTISSDEEEPQEEPQHVVQVASDPPGFQGILVTEDSASDIEVGRKPSLEREA